MKKDPPWIAHALSAGRPKPGVAILSELPGGGRVSGAGVAQEHREWWLRKKVMKVNGFLQVNFEKDGKVQFLSPSGLVLDCFLAALDERESERERSLLTINK